MKKEQFLSEIQREVTSERSRAYIVWEAAIKLDEKDPRWGGIEEHDLLGTFGLAFGVKLPKMVTGKQNISKVERFEKKLAKAKETYECVKNENPQFIPDCIKEIDYLEKKLAEAKGE